MTVEDSERAEVTRVSRGFSRNLVSLRSRSALSQIEVAERSGLHRTQVGLLESGRRAPRLDTIVRVAAGVGGDPCGLFAGLAWRLDPGRLRAAEAAKAVRNRGKGLRPGGGLIEHPSTVAEQFGRRLWRYRRKASLSQDDLSRLTGVHRTEISQLERGLRVPRLPTVLKLAAGVEVSACDLIDGLRWRPSSYEKVGGTYATGVAERQRPNVGETE